MGLAEEDTTVVEDFLEEEEPPVAEVTVVVVAVAEAAGRGICFFMLPSRTLQPWSVRHLKGSLLSFQKLHAGRFFEALRTAKRIAVPLSLLSSGLLGLSFRSPGLRWRRQ